MADKAPPQELDATGKKLYRDLRTYLRGQGTWEDSDHFILAETCLHHQFARLARADMMEGGKVNLTALGHRDQPVQHPSYKTYQSESKAFMDGLRELGLTPAQRKRLAIEVPQGGGGKFGL
jgi:P27 family predicted phage terminase small subunit